MFAANGVLVWSLTTACPSKTKYRLGLERYMYLAYPPCAEVSEWVAKQVWGSPAGLLTA